MAEVEEAVAAARRRRYREVALLTDFMAGVEDGRDRFSPVVGLK